MSNYLVVMEAAWLVRDVAEIDDALTQFVAAERRQGAD